MGGILLSIRTWWETADRTQKVVTIFGSSILLVLLAGTAYFSTRPKMALVYGGLTPSELGKVVPEIQKLGVPVEYDMPGNVLVPSDKVAEVRAMLARNGVAPASKAAADYSDFNMMQPKAVEDAKLLAVRQQEIAGTIEMIGGVQSAKVLLSPGERKGFANEEDRKSTRLNSSHIQKSRMPSSA